MSQTFFITGCASGIGRHMTGVLQARGDRVVATDLSFDALEETAKEQHWPEDRVSLRKLNVCSYAQWEEVFGEAWRTIGPIDVTMNVAGLLLASWAEESPLKEIDSQVDVNVKGVMYGTRVAAEHMVKRGSGHIVNIASIAGLVPVPGMSVYCGTKYAVRGYSLSAAAELRPKGVHVTALCPSTIQTPMLDNQLHNDAAEMFYSGHSILTLKDIEHVILNKVLTKKPYEVHIPKGKTLLARVVDLVPALGPVMAPLYQRSGRKRQAERRSQEHKAGV